MRILGKHPRIGEADDWKQAEEIFTALADCRHTSAPANTPVCHKTRRTASGTRRLQSDR